MSRTLEDIQRMALEDYAIGLTAHYVPLAEFVTSRSYRKGIEIGTAYGGNAVYLNNNSSIMFLYCVDPYKYYSAMPGLESQEDYETLYKFAERRLSEEKKQYSITSLFRQTSEEFYNYITFINETPLKTMREAAKKFDFVFLDGDHSYETVLWECRNYSNLIRENGALIGHDYNIFESVNNAVHEYAKETNKLLHFLDGNIWYLNM